MGGDWDDEFGAALQQHIRQLMLEQSESSLADYHLLKTVTPAVAARLMRRTM